MACTDQRDPKKQCCVDVVRNRLVGRFNSQVNDENWKKYKHGLSSMD